jgi:hypothetical protein
MASKGVTVGAILASLALAGVTLTLFSLSQLRGPEGSVHRFMIAVAEQDFITVNDITVGTEFEKRMAVGFVAQAFQLGARYQVVDVRQSSYHARVGVLLRFPDGAELPWIVAVRRVERDWQVDTGQSTRPGPAFMN